MPEQPLGWNPKNRILELDGLRGIAVLLVVVWHYIICDSRIESPILSKMLWIFQISWSGVNLFFVLSGFLVGGILLDNLDSPNYFRTFYIRRSCRILPLYYLVLAIFMVGYLFYKTPPDTLYGNLFIGHPPLWMYPLFVQNYWMGIHDSFGAYGLGVTWSLAIEEHFYLIFPLLLFIFRKNMIQVLILIILISCAVRLWLAPTLNEISMLVYTHCRLDGLCWGVLAACVLRKPGMFEKIQRRSAWLYLFTGSMALFSVWLIFNSPRAMTNPRWYPGFLSLDLFYLGILLLAITQPKNWLAWVLRRRSIVFFGKLSYCIYLIHIPIEFGCSALIAGKMPFLNTLSDLGIIALAFVVCIGVSWLSFRYFEAPIQKWGHKFKY